MDAAAIDDTRPHAGIDQRIALITALQHGVFTRAQALEEDIMTIDGIRLTRPAKTLLDLATVEPEEVIERCLDDALRRRLVSLPFLERWLADPARSRRRGARVLRASSTHARSSG